MGERIKESVTKQMENIQHTAENVGHRLSEQVKYRNRLDVRNNCSISVQFASKQTNDNKQPRKLTEKIKNVAANVQEKVNFLCQYFIDFLFSLHRFLLRNIPKNLYRSVRN